MAMTKSSKVAANFTAGVRVKTTVDLLLIEEENSPGNPNSSYLIRNIGGGLEVSPNVPFSSVAVPAGSTGITTEDPIFGHAFILLDDYQTVGNLDLWVGSLAVISPLELLAREG